MVTGIKETRKINSFVKVSIPSPRDLFRRYGERDSHGIYTSDGTDSSPVLTSGSSVISQIINAEKLVKLEMANKGLEV